MQFKFSGSIALALSIPLLSCTVAPFTGQAYTGTTNGYIWSFLGASDTPGTTVTAYVLADATDNPQESSNYTAIGSHATGTVNQAASGAPEYTFGVTASTAINSTEWPQGGLVRLMTESVFDGNSGVQPMYSVTNEFSACQTANTGQAWEAIGEICDQPYGGNTTPITVVSTQPTPFGHAPTSTYYLSWRGGVSGSGTAVAPSAGQAATQNYYTTIGAPSTLGGSSSTPGTFKTTFGFYSATDVANAKYYNAGDLGIGRDMYCWSFLANLAGARGRACYVTNYGVTGTPPAPQFGLDPQTVIAQVIAGTNPVATVAMIYNPTLVTNPVQFIVYSGTGGLLDFAALDNVGLTAIAHPTTPSNANVNIPNNCLTCHGTSSTYTPVTSGASVVAGAYFLPFDPAANVSAPTANLVFSNASPAYEQGPMLVQMAELNAHVYATDPSPATQAFLNGAYHTTAGPTGTSTFDDTYVPAGWTSPATGSTLTAGGSTELYNELIKPYCRTCHLSNTTGLDWSTEIEFQPFAPVAWTYVCGAEAPMPNSLQAQNRLWASPARAHLTNAFNLAGACTP